MGEETCDDGVQGPAAPHGITRKAPRQDKAESGQRGEGDKTEEGVETSVKGGSARLAWRIPQAWVGREETSANEGESEGAEQDGSPGGPMAHAMRNEGEVELASALRGESGVETKTALLKAESSRRKGSNTGSR